MRSQALISLLIPLFVSSTFAGDPYYNEATALKLCLDSQLEQLADAEDQLGQTLFATQNKAQEISAPKAPSPSILSFTGYPSGGNSVPFDPTADQQKTLNLVNQAMFIGELRRETQNLQAEIRQELPRILKYADRINEERPVVDAEEVSHFIESTLKYDYEFHRIQESAERNLGISLARNICAKAAEKIP